MARDLSFLIPEMTLAVAVVFMLLAEMARLPRLALGFGLVGLALAVLATFPVLDAATTVFGGTYRIDLLSGWAKLILLPGTALALLLARAELAGKDREGSVYSLLCLVTLGALMLAGGDDMMLLVLGVVLTGLGSFALVAYPRDDAATEAGMKYLVFGAVTGSVMIYGLTFWFGGAGTTLFSGLAVLGERPLIAIAGLLAVIVGLGYKASLVPFHFWAPDAYDGAPVSVAAYLSVITKVAAFFAFVRVLGEFLGRPVRLFPAGYRGTRGQSAGCAQRHHVRGRLCGDESGCFCHRHGGRAKSRRHARLWPPRAVLRCCDGNLPAVTDRNPTTVRLCRQGLSVRRCH